MPNQTVSSEKRKEGDILHLVCAWDLCAREFDWEVKPRGGQPPRFCSVDCREFGRPRRRGRPKLETGELLKVVCARPECEREFEYLYSGQGAKRRFCSHQCRKAVERSLRNGKPTRVADDVLELVCARVGCKRAFTWSGKGSAPRFCSDKCSGAARRQCVDGSAGMVRGEELQRICVRCDNPFSSVVGHNRRRYCDDCRVRARIEVGRASVYGMPVTQLWAMRRLQANRCALCGGGPGTTDLHIDHDHACCDRPGSCGLCVRALLCAPCNRNLLTDEMVLHKAAYILYWRNVGLSSGQEHLRWLQQWIITQASLINIEPAEIGVGYGQPK